MSADILYDADCPQIVKQAHGMHSACSYMNLGQGDGFHRLLSLFFSDYEIGFYLGKLRLVQKGGDSAAAAHDRPSGHYCSHGIGDDGAGNISLNLQRLNLLPSGYNPLGEDGPSQTPTSSQDLS
jgi:hypothetical protein